MGDYVKFAIFFLPVALCAGQSGAPASGRALFRSNCAFCHGADARGGRGPNLVSAPLAHGESDDAIKTVIREGVPGTSMPAFSEFTPGELANIVAYLKSLSHGVNRVLKVPGDAEKGRLVYAANGCSACHRIGTQGSVFGPDLSRIGSARSVEYIRESIVNPSADVPEEYEGVTVVTNDGRSVTGIRINEDTFSVQLRDASQKFRMFEKDQVREVKDAGKSLMPAYASLPANDLQNLVAYLCSLRAEAQNTDTVNKARGIK
jgi:putative heme-binding domain-containing protein